MKGGGKSASGETSSGTEKPPTPTAIANGTSGAEAAPAGGATVGAGAGAAAEEKAGIGSTEEAEVREKRSVFPHKR